MGMKLGERLLREIENAGLPAPKCEYDREYAGHLGCRLVRDQERVCAVAHSVSGRVRRQRGGRADRLTASFDRAVQITHRIDAEADRKSLVIVMLTGEMIEDGRAVSLLRQELSSRIQGREGLP